MRYENFTSTEYSAYNCKGNSAHVTDMKSPERNNTTVHILAKKMYSPQAIQHVDEFVSLNRFGEI